MSEMSIRHHDVAGIAVLFPADIVVTLKNVPPLVVPERV
jgi:hypothetical protein